VCEQQRQRAALGLEHLLAVLDEPVDLGQRRKDLAKHGVDARLARVAARDGHDRVHVA
jgi:hypothetical protein